MITARMMTVMMRFSRSLVSSIRQCALSSQTYALALVLLEDTARLRGAIATHRPRSRTQAIVGRFRYSGDSLTIFAIRRVSSDSAQEFRNSGAKNRVQQERSLRAGTR